MHIYQGETRDVFLKVECKDCGPNATVFTGILRIEADYQDISGKWVWQVMDKGTDYVDDEYLAGRIVEHHKKTEFPVHHNSWWIYHPRSNKLLGACGFGRHTAVVGFFSQRRFSSG